MIDNSNYNNRDPKFGEKPLYVGSVSWYIVLTILVVPLVAYIIFKHKILKNFSVLHLKICYILCIFYALYTIIYILKTSIIIIQDKVIVNRPFYKPKIFKITADTIFTKVIVLRKFHSNNQSKPDSIDYNSSNISKNNVRESVNSNPHSNEIILNQCNLIESRSSVVINLVGSDSKSISIVGIRDVKNLEDTLRKIINNSQLKEISSN